MTKSRDDELLARLAEQARAEGGPDATMDALARLAAGQLTTEEAAALNHRLRDDLHLRDAPVAFAPLSSETRAKLADAVAQKLATQRQPLAEGIVPIAAAASRRRRRLLLAAPALAAAAGLALVWRRGGPPEGDLESYRLELTAAAPERGALPRAPAQVLRVPRGSFFAVRARPVRRVTGPVAARAFVSSAAGFSELPAPSPASGSGVVAFEGRTQELFGALAGALHLHLIVGRPGIVAAEGATLAQGGRDEGKGWQRLSVRVELVD